MPSLCDPTMYEGIHNEGSARPSFVRVSQLEVEVAKSRLTDENERRYRISRNAPVSSMVYPPPPKLNAPSSFHLRTN